VPISIETREKISRKLKGRTSPHKGKKGLQPWHNISGLNGKGQVPWNKGRKRPEFTGKKHPRWKGNSCEDYRERRRFRVVMQPLVFARDNYTCQICNQYGGYLQVDHIQSWSEYPELRFIESNCRTFCMACHYYVTFKKKLPKGVIWGHNLSRRMAS
jgi:HNH endonuclease/NUMOD3 motif